jgi:hypothetical protein
VTTTDQGGSIDAVADSILMAEENDPTQIDVEDDEQSAEVTDGDEAADDVEADDADEADDEDHDDEDTDADDDAPEILHTVTVDGKPQQVTLDQLKQGYSGQTTIQKRFEEVALQRKQVAAFAEQLKSEAEIVLQTNQRLNSGVGIAPPQPPSRELFDRDPIGFMEAKLNYDEKVAEYQQTQQMLAHVQQQQQAQMQAQHQARIGEEMQYLTQSIPELADPQKATAYRDKLVKGAVEHYGLTAEMVQSESDHRAIRVLNDAIKYREMLAKSQGAQAKMQTARPVIKAGTKRSDTQSSAKMKQKVVSQMRSTGSVDDVAKFLLT